MQWIGGTVDSFRHYAVSIAQLHVLNPANARLPKHGRSGAQLQLVRGCPWNTISARFKLLKVLMFNADDEVQVTSSQKRHAPEKRATARPVSSPSSSYLHTYHVLAWLS